ncbi:MAG: hypothetical protein ACXU9U_00360 [Parachlamydiaceae bacterium]
MSVSLMSSVSFYQENANAEELYLVDQFNACYQCNRLGGLTLVDFWNSERSGNIAQIGAGELQSITISQPDMTKYVASLSEIYKNYHFAIRAIGTRLNWQFDGPEENLVESFRLWLAQSEKVKDKELDLSGLELKEIPPQICLFENLEKLNLSTNNLRVLPPILQKLPLKELNISENKRLQPNIPSWIGCKPDLKCVAYGIELRHLPEGITPEQMVCEKNWSTMTEPLEQVPFLSS